MKKFPLLIVFLALLSCVQRGKLNSVTLASEETDTLSDIAQSVTAIPLETSAQCKLSELNQVKQARSDFFICSGNAVYRFNRFGKLISRITLDHQVQIRTFTINPDHQQIIILDSLYLLHFFSFDGQTLFTKDITAANPGMKILDIEYFNQALWMITEKLSDDKVVERWMVKMDLVCRPSASQQLGSVDLGRFHLDGLFAPELCVTGQMVYVYSPSTFRESLLQDTLYLLSSGQLDKSRLFPKLNTGNPFPAYSIPLLLSGRYLIASYQANVSESENYLLCYDREADKAYSLNGFNDDFYHTGIVNSLQPLDPDNKEYYFCKSGKDVSAAFPERAADANPVLFLVRLNS